MGSGGVAIAALPTVICLKVPFSDGLGGEEFKKGVKDVEENVKDEGSEQTDKDPEVTNSRTESKLTTHSSKEEGTE